MFKPVNKTVSREKFSVAAGFTIDPSQTLRAGRMVLVGTRQFLPRVDLNWEPATWDESYSFVPTPDASAPTSDWSFYSEHIDTSSGEFPFGGQSPTTPGTPVFLDRYSFVPWFNDNVLVPISGAGNVGDCWAKPPAQLRIPEQPPGFTIGTSEDRSFLDLQGGDGESTYIYQDATHDNPWWTNNVAPNPGYTVEVRVMSFGRSTMVLDDGARRLELEIDEDGVYHNGSKIVSLSPFTLREDSVFHRLRVAVLTSDFFVLTDQGFGYQGFNDEPSMVSEFRLGPTSDAEVYVDYVKVAFTGVYVDIEDDLAYSFDTSDHDSYTPSLHHARKVASFDRAIVYSFAPYDGGTTKVQAQYKNTSNPSWTDYSTPTTLSEEQQTVDLSGIPVDSDGSDEVRFLVRQAAAASTSKPAPVDEIAVISSFVASGLTLSPAFGPVEGGNYVTILGPTLTFNGSTGVLVDGILLDPGDVEVVSSTELRVLWPAGTQDTDVMVETTSPTSVAATPYHYVHAYDRGIDRYSYLEDSHGGKSPWQIKGSVPDGEINLAYLTGPGVDVAAHAGIVDLSFLEAGNLVAGAGEPEFLGSPSVDTSGDGVTYSYAEAPPTEDMAVSAGAGGWRALGVPAPLFYKYLIGRGRFYVKTPVPIGTDFSADKLRSLITVHKKDGAPIPLDEFPWDIVYVTTDVNEDPLPTGVYGVVLLTTYPFIAGETVFVTASSVVDSADRWREVQGHTEIVNTYPIVLSGASRQGFSLVEDVNGDFSLEVVT